MGGPDVRPVVILADDDEAITSNLAPFLDRAGFTGTSPRTGMPRSSWWSGSIRTAACSTC